MLNIKIIAITGGSGSGKTTAAKMLQQLVGEENCKVLSQDNYYKDQSAHFTGDGSVNFDHPDAIDFSLIFQHLYQLKKGNSVQIPIYDFVTHTRKKETTEFTPTKFIIVDGTLILSQEPLRELFDCILFLDIPEDVRFTRRLKRDVEERGRTPEGVHTQFYTLVKPMHDLYIAPLIVYAHYRAQNDNEVKGSVEELFKKLNHT